MLVEIEKGIKYKFQNGKSKAKMSLHQDRSMNQKKKLKKIFMRQSERKVKISNTGYEIHKLN